MRTKVNLIWVRAFVERVWGGKFTVTENEMVIEAPAGFVFKKDGGTRYVDKPTKAGRRRVAVYFEEGLQQVGTGLRFEPVTGKVYDPETGEGL